MNKNNKICGKNTKNKIHKSVQTNIISKNYPKKILDFKLKQEINIKFLYNNMIMCSKGIVSRIYNNDCKNYYLIINKNDYEHLSLVCEDKQVIPNNILIKFQTIVWQTKKLIEGGYIDLFI